MMLEISPIRKLRLACVAVFAWLAVQAFGVQALAAEPAAAPSAAAPVRVVFETSEGRIVVEVLPDKAPKTVANFVQYVKDGFYDGTIFHRVIKGFMIQGGGFTPAMVQKPTRPPVPIESNNGQKNVRGSVAMARTSDPNSATAQFFINVVDNAFLDYPGQDGAGYTVFGRVVEGMDVVDKIRAVPTGGGDVPRTPVLIKSARIAQ
ncbi:MAG TPA: peptidylprolyl isomerase [Burkholderiaceae bacterium]|nr:peptidylprolyl isomerase [Burkholderiaceae bacterium]